MLLSKNHLGRVIVEKGLGVALETMPLSPVPHRSPLGSPHTSNEEVSHALASACGPP